VRSILSDKCFACHGPDAETIEGGLRLDLRDHAVKESQAIVPGDSSASELVRRIFAADELEVMPPPELHKALTPSEKEILRRWIDEGAEYEPHWAYAPMRRPERVDTTTIDTASSDRYDRRSKIGSRGRQASIRNRSRDIDSSLVIRLDRDATDD